MYVGAGKYTGVVGSCVKGFLGAVWERCASRARARYLCRGVVLHGSSRACRDDFFASATSKVDSDVVRFSCLFTFPLFEVSRHYLKYK